VFHRSWLHWRSSEETDQETVGTWCVQKLLREHSICASVWRKVGPGLARYIPKPVLTALLPQLAWSISPLVSSSCSLHPRLLALVVLFILDSWLSDPKPFNAKSFVTVEMELRFTREKETVLGQRVKTEREKKDKEDKERERKDNKAGTGGMGGMGGIGRGSVSGGGIGGVGGWGSASKSKAAEAREPSKAELALSKATGERREVLSRLKSMRSNLREAEAEVEKGEGP